MRRAWWLLFAMTLPCAQAGVYTHVDPVSGMTILNNVPAGAMTPPPRAGLAAVAPAAHAFPSVSRAQQTERDNERRVILQTELQSEQQALDAATAVRAASDVLARHAVNIAALKRELGR